MTPPALPLHAWPDLAHLTPTPIDVGLINRTWRLSGPTGPVAVLQALNTTIFNPILHEDLDAVTTHLHSKGLVTPRLLRPATGDLFLSTEDGEVWRALSWVGTRTITRVESPAEASSAGRLVGRFHAALSDLDWSFRNPRKGVHDTARHAGTLTDALAAHPDHPLFAEVTPLAETLLVQWQHLKAELPALPERVVHGDLKISNVRFDGPEAVALVDLDTLQRDTLGAELGDALRSWCATGAEDDAGAQFDLTVLDAALRGYALGSQAAPPNANERAAIVPSVLRITRELAMRFAADALNETYFGWDRARFDRAGHHNLARARGQVALANALERQRSAAERAVVGAFQAGTP